MQNENFELNLLANVSKTLIENSDPFEIVVILERIFNKYGRSSSKFIELKSFNIYIYDENTKSLKNYAKKRVVVEGVDQEAYNNRLHLILTQLSQFDFFVNGSPYKLEELTSFTNVKINEHNNIFLFPLKSNNRPFGILEMIFPNTIENLLDSDFFMLLSIASYQISLKIQNTLLTDQMQKNINFHKSMKNIAKIIETQYELNYIIPIIGEMIDRFVSNHLIYVFLKDEKDNSFNLVWPNSCRDKSILSIISDVNADSKFILINDDKVAIFPLVVKKTLLGCIVAHSNTDKLSEKEIDYLDQLSKQSSITIQRANTYVEVLQHATLDALTGLNNRRQFETRLKAEVSTSKRQGSPLCAMMLDVDFFKKVNDSYGHAAGDSVLKSVAATVKSALRESDIASRYGGEEFAIMLPFTKIEEAFAVAQRLRQAIEKSPVSVEKEKGEPALLVKVTVSIGVHEFGPNDTQGDLFEKADKALYEAKTTGRNKVVVFEEAEAKST